MPFFFDSEALSTLARVNQSSFANAQPFAHQVIDGLLPMAVAEELLHDFPKPDHPCWFQNAGKHPFQPSKQELLPGDRFNSLPASLRHVLQQLNAPQFLSFLEELTGIPHLIPDPYLLGGGVHQVLRGGSLAVHTDFNFHTGLQLFRRLNLLLYLNKDWDEGFGGHLELWDDGMATCRLRVSPLFNRMVVFKIAHANHGHPHPLNCPKDRSRKSLALYYYTTQPDEVDRKPTVAATWQNPVWLGDFLTQTLQERLLQGDRGTGRIRFKATGLREGSWFIDLGAGSVSFDEQSVADCTVTIDAEIFSAILTNRQTWERAFNRGQVALEGDRDKFFQVFALL